MSRFSNKIYFKVASCTRFLILNVAKLWNHRVLDRSAIIFHNHKKIGNLKNKLAILLSILEIRKIKHFGGSQVPKTLDPDFW